jgi:uncharacterized protein (TIGR02996 family)
VQSERTALLQSIIANPDDDTARLVYADWLEENGEESDVARAHYIRTALEKHQLHIRDPRRQELLDRMRALLKAHKSRWFPDSPLIRKSQWRGRHRGFIRHIRGTAAEFNKHAPALFAVEPVTDMYLEPAKPAKPGKSGDSRFDQFATSPLLSRMRYIDFPHGSVPPGGLAQVAGRLASLRKLEVNGWNANHSELDVFVRASWTHLEHLMFHRCGLDDDALGILVRMNVPQMKCLRLVTESFGSRGIGHLLGAPWLEQLTQLDLTQTGQHPTRDALQAIANSPQLANLQSLNLSHNHVGPEGLSVLAASPYFGQVRKLDLSYTGGGARGLIALFNSPTMRQVRDLSYSSNGIDFRDIDEEVTPWPSLRHLHISALSDHGLSWLLDHSLLDSVRYLGLFLSGITGVGCLALLRSSLPRSLVYLSLSHNHLGPLDGLPLLLEFPRLQTLELEECHLGAQGAVRLLRALRAPNLRTLTMYKNDLTNEAVQALTSNATLCNLEKLSLSYHPDIDDEGARLLCEASNLGRLKDIQLLDAGISDDALTRLRKRFKHVRR